MANIKGIDVSYHNGTIDWRKVKQSVDFAIIRAGYGRSKADKRFIYNITEARKAGLENADRFVDAPPLETEEDIRDAVNRYCVFGRVTPPAEAGLCEGPEGGWPHRGHDGRRRKRRTGLKGSRLLHCHGSGSDAARTVSNLVLLDSNFASMPLVVQEGRRSINNLQRSSSLFLVKTIFPRSSACCLSS